MASVASSNELIKMLMKFAEDTKSGRFVNMSEAKDVIQRYLKMLEILPENNNRRFYMEKCY